MRFAVAAFAAAIVFVGGAATAETCMKSGEQTSGAGAVCYYRCSFGETTQNVSAGRICPMTAQASVSGLNDPPRSGGACIKQGERTTGMSKQCMYDCGGTQKVQTVGAAQLCPISIR